jgi:hypothetical protein
MQGLDFLIRVNNHYFLQALDGSELSVTDTPSHAQHFGSYLEADSVCQRLRRRGHKQAIITDVEARVVTHEVLKALRAADSSVAPLPTTRAELDAITVAEYRCRYKSEPAFRQRADDLEQQPRVAAKTRR